jgi:hypothetical protein
MNSNKKIICEKFEREVFLFMGGELSNERMKLLKHHLEECNVCKSVLEGVKSVTTPYDALPPEDVDESVFIKIMNKATKITPVPKNGQKKYFPNRRSLIEMFGFYRLGFGGAAIVAAMILIVISFLKNTSIENKLSSELLDWNGEKITSKLEQIENQIISLRSDEWDIYVVRKNEKANWDATLKSIRKQINDMKKSTKNNEL